MLMICCLPGRYSRSLVTDLESELSGNLKKACLKWCKPPEFTEEVADFTSVDDIPEGTPTAEPPKPVKQKPNQAAMPPSPPGTACFYITCPAGVSPGQNVAICAFGSMVLVSVPAATVPGANFLAFLPVPGEGYEPEPQPVPDTWYYIDPNGQQQGPHTTEEMQGWKDYFPPDMQVMAPGAAAWAPLSSVAL